MLTMNYFCLHPYIFYVIISTNIMNLYIFAILRRVYYVINFRRVKTIASLGTL